VLIVGLILYISRSIARYNNKNNGSINTLNFFVFCAVHCDTMLTYKMHTFQINVNSILCVFYMFRTSCVHHHALHVQMVFLMMYT